MNIIKLLSKEILIEENTSSVPRKLQIILSQLVHREPFIAKLFSLAYTDYIIDKSMETAGVMAKLGRIKFYYNPEFIEKLTEAEINFLLQHEMEHIFRSHSTRGAAVGASTKRLHTLHNIAADALINATCQKDGGYGGLPMKVINGAWFLDDSRGTGYGSINARWGKDGVDDGVGTVKDGTDIYKGSEMSEAVYKWMMERDKIAQDKEKDHPKDPGDEEGDGKEGDGKGKKQDPWEPSIGDIIYNKKAKKYGKVVGRHGTTAGIEEITEEEARAVVGMSPKGTSTSKAKSPIVKKTLTNPVSNFNKKDLKNRIEPYADIPAKDDKILPGDYDTPWL